MQNVILGLLIGLCAGGIGGLFGLGGGILIVPALALLLGFSQKNAQGTSLATLVFPIGILGVINYAKEGLVNWSMAVFMAIGFLGGSYFGSKFTVGLPDHLVKRSFAIFLVIVAIYMFSTAKPKPTPETPTTEPAVEASQ